MGMRREPSAVSRQLSGRSRGGNCSAKLWPRYFVEFFVLPSCFWLLSCASKPDPKTLVMIIEFSPANLDPRVGLDAQSERIDNLLFDNLLARDEHLNVKPNLAERWATPDPRTYIFHLHSGVKFSDGRPLTSH